MLLLVVVGGCGFPRPPDVVGGGDDAGTIHDAPDNDGTAPTPAASCVGFQSRADPVPTTIAAQASQSRVVHTIEGMTLPDKET